MTLLLQTDRKIKNNKPDVVVKGYKRIDMSVSIDNNISDKEHDKITNYKHLEIETEKMWRLKTTSNNRNPWV